MFGGFQGIGQPLGSRARAKRFLLAVIGCPARQADDLECCGDSAFGICVLRLIQRSRPGEYGPSRGMAKPCVQRISFAHGAQVVHQVKRVTIPHGLGVAVCHGKGKAGPLQKGAKVADFAHGQYPWRQSAGDFGLGLGKAGSQFLKRLPTEKKPHEQTVRAQRVPALNQLPYRVICPMQRKRMDHQIVALCRQRQNLLIATGRAKSPPDLRERCHDHRRRKGSVNLFESFLDFQTDILMQESLGCAGAVPVQRGAVGQDRWCLHVAEHEGRIMGMQAALHLIYPPQCICCDARVTTDFGLCGTCWKETPFITGLVCDLCGAPLPGQDNGHIAHCDDCLTVARPWHRGRSVMLYRDRARDIVLQLKHADRVDLARPAGTWLARAAQPLMTPDTILVPIPLHWTRLLRRRYNQSVLLAAQISRQAGAPHLPDLLKRLRNTQSQEGRSRDDRFRNLHGAISVHPRRAEAVRNRSVLLVDDVLTSGATFAAAAEACLAAGARQVCVLALSRVAKEA